MRTSFGLLTLTLLAYIAGWGVHGRRHPHTELVKNMWTRRHKKHEIDEQKQKVKIAADDDVNITRIYDRINRFDKHPVVTVNGTKRSSRPQSPGLWQFDTAGNDDVKLLISDVSKSAANIVKTLSQDDTTLVHTDLTKPSKASIVGGERRGCISDCGINGLPGPSIPPNHRGGRFSQFSNELFMPGVEKTFSEPMSILNHRDGGPFHHYENGGHPLIGGLAHGTSIVTHQMDYETSPRQVFMHGIEKIQRK